MPEPARRRESPRDKPLTKSPRDRHGKALLNKPAGRSRPRLNAYAPYQTAQSAFSVRRPRSHPLRWRITYDCTYEAVRLGRFNSITRPGKPCRENRCNIHQPFCQLSSSRRTMRSRQNRWTARSRFGATGQGYSSATQTKRPSDSRRRLSSPPTLPPRITHYWRRPSVESVPNIQARFAYARTAPG